MTTMEPGQPGTPPPRQGMTGGQIFALLVAIVLLFPGLCFSGFGVTFLADTGAGMPELGLFLGAIGLAIFGLAWLLFRVALRKRTGSPGTGT